MEWGDLGAATGAISDALADAITAGAPVVDDPAVDAPAGLEVEVLSGDALIWHAGARELHHLSASATAVWRACRESTDPAVVANVVTIGTRPGLLADVMVCIDELAALGLLDARPIET